MYKNIEENMVCCPYNRYHVVSKLRIQKHIIKCQKNNPDIKLATCFYNYTHRLKPEDMLKHYEICSHKTRVDGARYYEPGSYNPAYFSMKSDDHSFNFPDTRVKTQQHFYNPSQFSSKIDLKYKQNFKVTNCESEAESSRAIIDQKNLAERDFYGSGEDSDNNEDNDDDDDDDDDFKPLPLPKTVSKAFTCIKQHQGTHSATVNRFETRVAGFGRAKNSFTLSLPRLPRKTDHLFPNLSDMEIILPEKKTSKFVSRSEIPSCNESIMSSKFDDTMTLKSQDIIFDDDDDDDDNVGAVDAVVSQEVNRNDFLLQNLDDYVKIKG